MAIDKGLKGIVIGLGTSMLWYVAGTPLKINVTLSDINGDGILDVYTKQQSYLGVTWQCKAYLSTEDMTFKTHDLLQEPELRSELERKFASENSVVTLQSHLYSPLWQSLHDSFSK